MKTYDENSSCLVVFRTVLTHTSVSELTYWACVHKQLNSTTFVKKKHKLVFISLLIPFMRKDVYLSSILFAILSINRFNCSGRDLDEFLLLLLKKETKGSESTDMAQFNNVIFLFVIMCQV